MCFWGTEVAYGGDGTGTTPDRLSLHGDSGRNQDNNEEGETGSHGGGDEKDNVEEEVCF